MAPLLLALFLGLKHSVDADHLMAVSQFVTRERYLSSALRLGLLWAAGHLLTATVLTFVFFFFGETILAPYLSQAEKAVGLLLIALGLLSIRTLRRVHGHAHTHGGQRHTHLHDHRQSVAHAHRHIIAVGVFQGLASNDELLVLLTVAVGLGTAGGILAGAALFSLGTILGMLAFSFLVNFPLSRHGIEPVKTYIVGASAVISICYGLLIMAAIL